ncbi:MAG: hypothetical protein K1X94_16015 [Sandaracinaceae bacterium]|nr:hypothetical protein [Sandaracinaceae bacterium]
MTEGLRLSIGGLTPAATTTTAARTPDTATQGASFRDALRDAAHDMASREAAIDRVLQHRGAPLGPEQLLALQATVHRHSQEVELAAKLTDKLTGTVRQVLTSQQ